MLDARAGGQHVHVLADDYEFDPVYDAHPGSAVAVYVPKQDGVLTVEKFEWGFPLDGKPVRRQYRFRLPGTRAFLLAAIREEGHFSIITTAPSASVAPVHDCMPLVLGSGESGVWLGSIFAILLTRSGITLDVEPDCL